MDKDLGRRLSHNTCSKTLQQFTGTASLWNPANSHPLIHSWASNSSRCMWKCHLSYWVPGVKHNLQFCSAHSPHSCSFESSTKVAGGTFYLLVKVQEYTSPLGSPLISLFPHCSFQFLSHTAATRAAQSSVLSPLVFVSSSFLSCTISLETPPKAFLALWAIMAIQYWGKTATGAEEPSQHLKIISHFHKIRADWPQFFSTQKSTWLLFVLFTAQTCVIWCSALRQCSQNSFMYQVCCETSGCSFRQPNFQVSASPAV